MSYPQGKQETRMQADNITKPGAQSTVKSDIITTHCAEKQSDMKPLVPGGAMIREESEFAYLELYCT